MLDPFTRVLAHRNQARALRDLAFALTQVGCYREAREVAGTIEHEGERAKALSSLATALAQVRDESRANAMFGEAQEAARTIEDDGERPEAPSSMVSALGQAGRFDHALTLLGVRTLDEFLQALAEWAPSFEQVKPGVSVDVLRAATSIAGWVRAGWGKIHERLNS